MNRPEQIRAKFHRLCSRAPGTGYLWSAIEVREMRNLFDELFEITRPTETEVEIQRRLGEFAGEIEAATQVPLWGKRGDRDDEIMQGDA